MQPWPLASLLQEREGLKLRMTELSQTLGPGHAELVKVKRQLDAVQQRIEEIGNRAGGPTTGATAP